MSETMWKPIATAPKDQDILGFWSYLYPQDTHPTIGMKVISWADFPYASGWYDGDGVSNPGIYTHWMELPAPPPAS